MGLVSFLGVQDVIELHDEQIAHYGGSYGILNPGLLESAVMSPQMSMGGQYLNSTVFEMAAALAIGLACNHCFQDGNKRTAAFSSIIFLGLNGYRLEVEQNVFKEVIHSIVAKTISKERLAQFFENHAVSR